MTPKQTEVLGWVQKGLSNKQIAKRLDISESTVKLHMSALLKIYAVQTRSQLAIYSLGSNLPVMPTLETMPYAWVKRTDNGTAITFSSPADDSWLAVYKKAE